MTSDPHRSGPRRIDWTELLHGPVKCQPPSLDTVCKLEAKRDAAEFLDVLGLSIRECARLIGRDESELRHWLDERRLDREVPASFYSRVFRAVGPKAIHAWRMQHAAWIRDDKLTGTG